MAKVKLTITKNNCTCGYYEDNQEFIIGDLCPPICSDVWYEMYPVILALQKDGIYKGKTEFDFDCKTEGKVGIHVGIIG